MKTITLFMIFLCCLATTAFAQKKTIIPKKDLKACAFNGTLPQSVGFDASALPNDDAQKYLDTILGLAKIPILLRIADSVKNAVATRLNGQRYILYNPDFLKQFRQGGNARWAAYSVLAHEVGHHVSGHDFDITDPQRRKDMETEADEYSARVLRSLCAKREDAQAGLNALPKNMPKLPNYPSITVRLNRTGRAWELQDSLFRNNIVPDPCVDRATKVQLKYGDLGKLAKINVATDVWANVFNDRAEFSAKIPYSPKRQRVFTHLIFDQAAPQFQRVRSFKWKTNPFQPGDQTLIWDYKKDGFDRKQAEQLGQLSICAFDKNPAPTTPKELILWGGTTGLGAGLLTWGGLTFNNSWKTYQVYKQNTFVNADIYNERDQTRAEVKTEADKKLTRAVILGTIGTVVLTYSLKKLIARSKRNKRTYILIPNTPQNL